MNIEQVSPSDEINESLGYDADVNEPSQYCKHGTFVGSWWGPDYTCTLCESGYSAPHEWAAMKATWKRTGKINPRRVKLGTQTLYTMIERRRALQDIANHFQGTYEKSYGTLTQQASERAAAARSDVYSHAAIVSSLLTPDQLTRFIAINTGYDKRKTAETIKAQLADDNLPDYERQYLQKIMDTTLRGRKLDPLEFESPRTNITSALQRLGRIQGHVREGLDWHGDGFGHCMKCDQYRLMVAHGNEQWCCQCVVRDGGK